MSYDFTTTWHWPQRAFVFWLFAGMMMAANNHGKERRETSGPNKGEVEKHNAFVVMMRCALIVFFLICGGFFA